MVIDVDNVTLTPPLLYMHGDVVNDEVKSLINSITDFFSQRTRVYLADLTVSCNEWGSIRNEYGQVIGKKRKDVTFPLNSLSRIDVYDSCLKFTLINSVVYDVKVNKDFFYFFEWEREKYD